MAINDTNITTSVSSAAPQVYSSAASYSDRWVSWLPNWVIILIALVAALLIYKYLLPDDLKPKIKAFLSKYGFVIIIVILWLYYRKRWGFIYEDPSRWPANMYYATFLAALLIGIYVVVMLEMYRERYHTYGFISNNVCGSCSRRLDIGKFTVFFIGTSGRSDDHIVLPFPIPQKIVVVPKVSWDFVGSHIVAMSQVFKRDLSDIPPAVRHFLETDTFAKLAKDEIYYGLWTEKMRAVNPKVNEIEATNTKLNERIAVQEKMLKGKLSETKIFVSDTMATIDKIKGKSWLGGGNNNNQPMEESYG